VTIGRRVLFLIPARGGSKGIQRKNLRLLAGIPLVGHAARCAQAAARQLPGSGHRIVCSTDDAEIAEAARRWGAEVPFLRPEGLATDSADALDVALHALDHLDGKGVTFAALVLVQPTSPLRTPEDLVEAVNQFFSQNTTSVASVVISHPPHWTFRLLDGRIQEFAAAVGTRRQDYGDWGQLNGAVFVIEPAQLREMRRFVEPGVTVVTTMPAERSIDIDTESDFAICQALLRHRVLHGEPASVAIGRRQVGSGHPCFVIAEAGVNHGGSLARARELVDVAAASGADAVKFQTFRAENVISRLAMKAAYQQQTTGQGSQLEMVRALELPPEAFRDLAAYCEDKRILFASTPYDEPSADLLVELGVAFLKVPSGEITNLPFLAHQSRYGLPLILSTGMATLIEVETAVGTIRDHGDPPLVLLHCVSNYPAEDTDANLRAMHTLAAAYGVPVGYSDHTLGSEVALAAVAMGASVIEKHITTDRSLPGPDHLASLEPDDFAALCRGIRRVESARGHGRKEPAASEAEVAAVARRSLVAARDIAAGTVLTADLIAIKRPGTGLPPSMRSDLVGRQVKQHVPADTILTLDLFA
jgi:N,N'-diacetyllegionaminate synthase